MSMTEPIKLTACDACDTMRADCVTLMTCGGEGSFCGKCRNDGHEPADRDEDELEAERADAALMQARRDALYLPLPDDAQIPF